jgi:hypothetical protein
LTFPSYYKVSLKKIIAPKGTVLGISVQQYFSPKNSGIFRACNSETGGGLIRNLSRILRTGEINSRKKETFIPERLSST